MKRFCLLLTAPLVFVWLTAWASEPIPTVTGDTLNWPEVDATTINVHAGTGAYIESLPGNATSWTAPGPGDYFLVAADERDWPHWPRSETVSIEDRTPSGAPRPTVEQARLVWPAVSAVSINVHRGDGSYVETLPGTATFWFAPEFGDYFLVATNEGDWPSWPRSETVSITNDSGSIGSVTGLRADVYSGTAAEIFWDRNQEIGIRYIVFADGQEVANVDGTSWFSDSFAPGSTTVMSVQVVDATGNQFAPTNVLVTTPGDESAVALPTINRDNYEELLTDVFSAYFGAPYSEPLIDLTNNLLGGVISAADPFDAPYSCVNGGQAIFDGPFAIQFDNCRIGSAVHSGEFFIGVSANTSFGGDITLNTDMNTEINFTGNIGGFTISTSGFVRFDNVNVSLKTAARELKIEDANHQFTFFHLLNSSPNFQSTYQGSFRLSSPNTGDQFVSAEILTGFSYSSPLPPEVDMFYQPTDWNHSEGSLSVSAADGSRLILNADTGDDDTVNIQLINGTEMEEFNQFWVPQWAAWRQILPR